MNGLWYQHPEREKSVLIRQLCLSPFIDLFLLQKTCSCKRWFYFLAELKRSEFGNGAKIDLAKTFSCRSGDRRKKFRDREGENGRLLWFTKIKKIIRENQEKFNHVKTKFLIITSIQFYHQIFNIIFIKMKNHREVGECVSECSVRRRSRAKRRWKLYSRAIFGESEKWATKSRLFDCSRTDFRRRESFRSGKGTWETIGKEKEHFLRRFRRLLESGTQVWLITAKVLYRISAGWSQSDPKKLARDSSNTWRKSGVTAQSRRKRASPTKFSHPSPWPYVLISIPGLIFNH